MADGDKSFEKPEGHRVHRDSHSEKLQADAHPHPKHRMLDHVPAVEDQMRERGLLPGVEIATPIAPSEFSDKALDVFDRIDKDKNGYISTKELAEAMQDPSFRGQDAQVLATLYQSRYDLAGSQISFGRGISRADVEKFRNLEQKHAQDKQDAADLHHIFEEAQDPAGTFMRIHKSSMGGISKGELSDALKDKSLSESERHCVQVMLDKYDTITYSPNNGVTRWDLQHYPEKVASADEYKTIREIDGYLQIAHESQKDVSRDLYSDKVDPLKSIVPAAVKQGNLEDCYLEAPVSVMALHRPHEIQKMIVEHEKAEGANKKTYTVTFPGAPGEPITVEEPTEAELAMLNLGGKHGIWGAVIEKAYGQYCQQSWHRRSWGNIMSGELPEEGAGGGGGFDALKLLSAKDFDVDTLSLTREATTREKLIAAMTAHPPKLVVAGIDKRFSAPPLWTKGLQQEHMYSVMAFNPEGPDGGTVTVRDPQGVLGRDGVKEIPFKSFVLDFSEIGYEQP